MSRIGFMIIFNEIDKDTNNYIEVSLYGLKHHIVEMRGGVTDAGRQRQTLKIELLSQLGSWRLSFAMIQDVT